VIGEQPKRTPEQEAALIARIKAETSGKVVQHPAAVTSHGRLSKPRAAPKQTRAKPKRTKQPGAAAQRPAAEPQASPSLLAWMNERHAVVFDYGGRCVVADIAGQGDTVRTFHTDDFKKRYQNRMVGMGKQSVPLGDWWLTHPRREEYFELVLRPDTLAREVQVHGRRCLNLWRGFAVKPKAGDWGRMREHIYNVLAAGNTEAAEYIIRWAAFGVQHPIERAEQALCWRGEEGIGKGTFANAYLRLFGPHGFRVQSAHELTGRFNAHFRDCVLVLADEGIWGGDKAAENKLKGLITEPTFPLEPKGKDIIRWPNYLSLMVTSNAKWIVPAGPKARRFTILEPSESHWDDKPYFDAIQAELASGGLAAMLHDLLDLPLGGWHPRVGFKTPALQDQKRHSLEPAWKALEMMLQDGILTPNASPPHASPLAALVRHARDIVPFLKTRSDTELKEAFRFVGATARHNSAGDARLWYFPALTTCRKTWQSKFGAWQWDPVNDRR
jgi:hypothetical protein